MKMNLYILVLLSIILAYSTSLAFEKHSVTSAKHFKKNENNILMRYHNKLFSSSPNRIIALDNTSEKTKFSLNPKELFHWYSNNLIEHPYITKIITGTIVGCLGDYLIQLINIKKSNGLLLLDKRRLMVFSTVIGFYISPAIHIWFSFLNNLALIKDLSKLKKTLIMLLIDQTLGAVLINSGFFFAFEMAQSLYPPYISNASILTILNAGKLSLTKNLWKTLTGSWMCWPFINLLNFAIIPIQFQVLFANFAAIFWNMFLSTVANS